jgi:hypothetical protein
MPRRTFEQLNTPIDTDIDWTIDGFDFSPSAGKIGINVDASTIK